MSANTQSCCGTLVATDGCGSGVIGVAFKASVTETNGAGHSADMNSPLRSKRPPSPPIVQSRRSTNLRLDLLDGAHISEHGGRDRRIGMETGGGAFKIRTLNRGSKRSLRISKVPFSIPTSPSIAPFSPLRGSTSP